MAGRTQNSARRSGASAATSSSASPKSLSDSVRIGVAGWSILSRYAEQFPGEGSHLERYAGQLNCVEINSSFYRHHQQKTYARWAASVPDHFRFAVKIPQALTHEGELSPDAEVLDRFIEETQGLGNKLAVLLVQLPPKLEFQVSKAKRFFNAIKKRTDVRIVCEPRHPSWNTPRAETLLKDREIARVAADPPLWPGGNEPAGYTGLVYFRWHGQPRKYYSDYGKDCLTALEKQIANSPASEVWAVFDNTAHGFALENALSVATSMRPRRSPAAKGGRRTLAPSPARV